MKKLLISALIFASLASGCVSPIDSRRESASNLSSFSGFNRIYNLFHSNRTCLKDIINYERVSIKRLEEIDFKDEEKVCLPGDLEDLINSCIINQEYKDKEKFRRRLYRKYGLSKEAVGGMMPYELLMKCAEIVADNISYQDDADPKLNGLFEDDFDLERENKGDCNKYAHTMIYVFNLLKEHNPRLRNVYVGKGTFARARAHDWNAVFVISEGDLQIGMLDITFSDNNGRLDGFNEYHVSKFWRANFLSGIRDYETALKYLDEYIQNTKNEKELTGLLFDRAHALFSLRRYEEAAKLYEQLENPSMGRADFALYRQIECYSNLGEKEKEKSKIKMFLEKYPRNFWARFIQEIPEQTK